ncbi:hypothetical protein PRUB_a0184 [Pseudoalteromonas rubra]|uniref:Uncharacterized protein n=1 Tax=Pseudoalteromonas rubra TaxID=43658 RepID=A0A8T0C545_9GAMM|nr:hypothetical protein PRUB_a0184 [Pseudoalteromonas rubra]
MGSETKIIDNQPRHNTAIVYWHHVLVPIYVDSKPLDKLDVR